MEDKIRSIPAVMAVTEGHVREVAVHIRGSHLQLADSTTPRGTLSALAERLESPAMPDESSGRLQLAEWLTAPDHPLTARVMVNRLWQQHFGWGLVRSSSNFGSRGERPTHPRLLDWLADEFIRSGWSIKQMHRLIVTSRTYRMSSRVAEHEAAADPENRWLWRQNRRRLEVEPIRDSLFAVNDDLDFTQGGALDQKQGQGPGSFDAETVPRRAVYLPVNRSRLFEMFAIFDYSDASVHIGRRPTTTVSHQALFMMNNRLVMQQAERLARRLQALDGDRERIDRLHLRMFGREPSDDEAANCAAYVHETTRFLIDRSSARSADGKEDCELQAWTSLCRVLFATNEFIFVE